jgi:replicative DNA helicase
MSNQPLPELWVTYSHKVLSSVLQDSGAIFPVMDITHDNSHWFPGKDRLVYDAVLQCVKVDTVPTVEAVSTRLNGQVPAGYVKTIAAMFNDEDNRLLIYNTEQLRDFGILAKFRELGREISQITEIDEISQVALKQAEKITSLVVERTTRDSSAPTTNQSAWAMVEKFQGNGVLTGLGWFDELTGGLWPGMNYWIVGPYKSGKSSLMRNIVLNAATGGCPVGILAAEGTREKFVLDCQAMMASVTLANAGVPANEIRLDGLSILRHYYRAGYFKRDELNAINQAKKDWDLLPVNIWDSKDGVEDLTQLKYTIRKAKLNHGTQVFFMDYSQLFGKGTIYERQSDTALTVQRLASAEDVAMVLLSQQNEEGVKTTNKSNSPNAKGGGDAPAAADFLLMPTLDSETSFLTILLKLSRHSKMGMSKSHFVSPSGLIMDRWGEINVTAME